MYRNVALLALCQAVLLTGTSILVSVSALVGRRLSDDPALATVPLALQFLALTLATVPASLLMQRYGRRAGFVAGGAVGLAGAVLAAAAIVSGSFVGFCVAAVLLGAFNGTGQFYRFAAADVADPAHAGRAISLVLAGGIAAGFLGPNLAAWSRELLAGTFAATFLALAGLYALSMLAAAALRIPLPRVAAPGERGRPLRVLARQPRFIVAVLAAASGYGVMNLVMVATPLAMENHAHPFEATAFVIQWHVLGMFLPSFFTGPLIRRFGIPAVMAAGVVALSACVTINLSGAGVWHYWSALVSLGVGWNFLFVGGTTLLTETHSEAEKGRCQALNDFIVFGTVTATALSSGPLLAAVGWRALNAAVVPVLLLVVLALLWLRSPTASRAAATASPGDGG